MFFNMRWFFNIGHSRSGKGSLRSNQDLKIVLYWGYSPSSECVIDEGSSTSYCLVSLIRLFRLLLYMLNVKLLENVLRKAWQDLGRHFL